MKNKTLALLESEINEVNKELEYNKKLQLKYPEREGLKVNYRTMEYVRNQLLERREKLAQRLKLEECTIILEGDPIQSNRITSTFLTKILSGWQNMIFRIARSKMEGPKTKGEISQEIKEASLFDVSAFSPGSFKIILSSHIYSSGNSTLEPTLGKEAFDSFTELIKCEDDINKIHVQWETLGDSVILEYKSLLGNIYSNKVNVTFQDEKTSKTISSELAQNVYNIIQNLDEIEPDTVRCTGILCMIDLDRNRFGFIRSDEEEKRIDGKFSEDMDVNVNHLGKLTTAKFLRQRKYSRAKDDYKYTWLLVELDEIDTVIKEN